jgi:hypothetical protein
VVVLVALRPLGVDQAVEAGGHLALPLPVGVLVDQRSLLGGLARPDHREPEAVREADDSMSPALLPAEGGAAKGCTLFAHEDQTVRPLLGVPGEMSLQFFVEEVR